MYCARKYTRSTLLSTSFSKSTAAKSRLHFMNWIGKPLLPSYQTKASSTRSQSRDLLPLAFHFYARQNIFALTSYRHKRFDHSGYRFPSSPRTQRPVASFQHCITPWTPYQFPNILYIHLPLCALPTCRSIPRLFTGRWHHSDAFPPSRSHEYDWCNWIPQILPTPRLIAFGSTALALVLGTELLIAMAGPHYSFEQLKHLRDSPLIRKPDNLPTIEQWIE